jgi:hypothetical protein
MTSCPVSLVMAGPAVGVPADESLLFTPSLDDHSVGYSNLDGQPFMGLFWVPHRAHSSLRAIPMRHTMR